MFSPSLTHQCPRTCRGVLIGGRHTARPTSVFVANMVNFFVANEARLAEKHAAVLVSIGVVEPSQACGLGGAAFGPSMMRPRRRSG